MFNLSLIEKLVNARKKIDNIEGNLIIGLQQELIEIALRIQKNNIVFIRYSGHIDSVYIQICDKNNWREALYRTDFSSSNIKEFLKIKKKLLKFL